MRVAASLLVFSLLLLGLAACGDGASPDDAAYADSMATQHRNDRPEPSGAVQPPRRPVEARAVRYGLDSTRTWEGYYAEPSNPDSLRAARGGPLPMLLVVHEWWGLNDNIRAMTRRLAGEGYRALAVDLYNGGVASTPDEARGLMERALSDDDALEANLNAGYAWMAQGGEAPSAAIGWCFGGGVAYKAAHLLGDRLDGAVIYYGRVSTDPAELARLQVPVLGLFGADDEGIPVKDVETFQRVLQENGKNAEIHIYEGAGHAFANPSGRSYHAAAAEAAWEQTTTFLRERLYERPDVGGASTEPPEQGSVPAAFD